MTRQGISQAVVICAVAAVLPFTVGWPVGAVAQYTAGGFGNGDTRTIPAFQEAVAGTTALFRLQVPTDSGGMADLIRILLSADLREGGAERLPPETAKRVQRGALLALGRPSTRPSRLYSVRRAFALAGRGRQVVILVCDCGTSTLAMQAGDGSVALSPQLDTRDLGLGDF